MPRRDDYWKTSFEVNGGRRGKRPDPPAETGQPCLRGDRCSGGRRSLETGDWHPAPAAQHVCLACRSVLEQALADLPGAFSRLALLSQDPARSGRAARVPPGSRVLLNAEADALMRETSDITGNWASRVRSVPQLSLIRHAYPHGSADQVTADCRTLGLHLDPLLALPPGPVKRTWTWNPGGPMPADLEEVTGHLDAVNGGDGWVTAFTELHGGDAACELIDLHRRALRLLRETPAPREHLDGIPCRECEAFGLERASLPAVTDPAREPPFSSCPACRDTMTRPEYDEWAAWYAAWARGQDLACARCQQGRCGECCYAPCSCRASGHAAAALRSRSIAAGGRGIT